MYLRCKHKNNEICAFAGISEGVKFCGGRVTGLNEIDQLQVCPLKDTRGDVGKTRRNYNVTKRRKL
ncbi:hypothetical protein LCGC14_0351580 [marine sediment metagenome]|uniref:Uncharacterized protein n=1 Tax=marine sediment metagenome TaxID=412755 RepID=A0A0F9TGB2_9ZZZZ